MNKVLVVARREVAERSFVFLVAAVLAVTPFLALLAHGDRQQKLELVALLAGAIAVVFMTAMSATLGNSLVGPETRDRRLSFYFSRPLTAGQIWFGKLLAAVFIIVVCAAMMLTIPSSIDPQGWRLASSIPFWKMALMFTAVCVALPLLAHTTTTALRSGTAWYVADFVLAILAVAVFGFVVFALLIHQAKHAVEVIDVGALAALVLAMAFAGWIQLRDGRTDARSQHRASAKALWPWVAVIVLAALSFLGWMQSAHPADLTGTIAPEGRGRITLLSGRVQHRMDYRAAFLVDSLTGSSLDVTAVPFVDVVSSTSGTAGAWLVPSVKSIFHASEGPFGEGEVSVVRVRDGGLEKIDTGLVARFPPVLAIDDAGDHLALVSGDVLAVHDLRTHHLVASAALPKLGDSMWPQLQFLRNGSVRITESTFSSGKTSLPATLQIFDFNPSARSLRSVFTRTSPVSFIRAASTADGATVAILEPRPLSGVGTVRRYVFDAASGRQILETQGVAGGLSGILRLSDGRMAAMASEGNPRSDRRSLRMIVYSSGGEPLRVIPLGDGAFPRVVGEVAPGKVVVCVVLGQGRAFTETIDCATGAVANRVEGQTAWAYGPLLAGATTSEQLIVTGANGVDGSKPYMTVWNALTGVTRPLPR